jgi:hypothetical protein
LFIDLHVVKITQEISFAVVRIAKLFSKLIAILPKPKTKKNCNGLLVYYTDMGLLAVERIREYYQNRCYYHFEERII